MKIIDNKLYLQDVNYVSNLNIHWEKLKGKNILISGATGLLGSFLIDVIMQKNLNDNLNCKVIALGRNENKIKDRFESYYNSNLFVFIQCDINSNIFIPNIDKIEYIVHLASNTHPKMYSTDPIGTISTNIIGTSNLLNLAIEKKSERFVFASTCEIYGENKGDVEKFSEDYCGYINCNTLRAGYPESKRCGEALCQAYSKQKDLDIVIPRFTRSYGPTMLMNDTKALSQFIKKAINNEDIVLKSDGSQFYSYTYVADAISGLLTIMLEGKSGEAYNISYDKSDITLKELASIIAEMYGKKVIFEIPDEIEKAGYSKATKAILDSTKLNHLGWNGKYNIKEGIKRTITILKDIN